MLILPALLHAGASDTKLAISIADSHYSGGADFKQASRGYKLKQS
jgi:hypothetical protein